MAVYNLLKLQRKMKKELDTERYQHTLGVMFTSASLAMCYGEDLEKAQVAGLLHDCAKNVSHKDKVRMCHKAGIGVTQVETELVAHAPS